MVGVGHDDRSALAQVCITNSTGGIVYLTHVQPDMEVNDWRTWVSGIEPHHVDGAPSFDDVVKVVSDLTKGRVIVGHGLKSDLKALMMDHPRRLIRDTSTYPPFRWTNAQGKSRPRRLQWLAKEYLGRLIQTGEHSPEEDAVAAMDLFKLVRDDWEAWLRNKKIAPKAPKPVPLPEALKEKLQLMKQQKEERRKMRTQQQPKQRKQAPSFAKKRRAEKLRQQQAAAAATAQ